MFFFVEILVDFTVSSVICKKCLEQVTMSKEILHKLKGRSNSFVPFRVTLHRNDVEVEVAVDVDVDIDVVDGRQRRS